MTKQPKVRKPHPILHGIGLVLSVILLVAVLVATYVLSTLATVIDSFFGAPSGPRSGIPHHHAAVRPAVGAAPPQH